MGVPNQPVLLSHDLLPKGKCDLSNPLWSKVLVLQVNEKRCLAQATGTQERINSGFKTGRNMKLKIKSRTSRFQMKRRAFLERLRRSRPAEGAGNGIQRKVRILKKLIPNSETKEIETLLKEAVDYILAMQMRVKAMQIMVNLLSGSDHNE